MNAHVREIKGTQYKLASASAPPIIKGRVCSFICSEEKSDRYGDVIMASGWDLKDFKNNPIALLNHQSRGLPIGRWPEMAVSGKRLLGDVEFAEKDVYELADTVFKLVKGGFLNAVSVGFLPESWEAMYEKNDFLGIRFVKHALTECSVVTVPALASALVTARSMGIEVDPLREEYQKRMDGWDADPLAQIIERKQIEDVWGATFAKTTVTVKAVEDDEADEPIVRKGSKRKNKAGDVEALDHEGNVIGIMVNGSLKVSESYQQKLAERNIKAIEQKQAEPADAPLNQPVIEVKKDHGAALRLRQRALKLKAQDTLARLGL